MIDLRRRQESNLRSGNYRVGHMAVTMTLTSWLYAAIPVFLFVTPGGPVCRRPSAPAFGMTGIALARFPAGSGYAPYCLFSSPCPRLSQGAAAHGYGGTRMLAHREACRTTACGSSSGKKSQQVKDLLRPQGPHWFRRMDLHHPPQCPCIALCCLSYVGCGC